MILLSFSSAGGGGEGSGRTGHYPRLLFYRRPFLLPLLLFGSTAAFYCSWLELGFLRVWWVASDSLMAGASAAASCSSTAFARHQPSTYFRSRSDVFGCSRGIRGGKQFKLPSVSRHWPGTVRSSLESGVADMSTNGRLRMVC